MGQVLVEVCNRCHAPYEDGGKWVKNGLNQRLHQCPDGVMGELAELPESEAKPIKKQKFIKPDGHVFLQDVEERMEIHPSVFKVTKVSKMRVRCPLCDQPVWGDRTTLEAAQADTNFFQCECGEWQEYIWEDAQSRWLLVDYSRTPQQETPEPSGCQHEWFHQVQGERNLEDTGEWASDAVGCKHCGIYVRIQDFAANNNSNMAKTLGVTTVTSEAAEGFHRTLDGIVAFLKQEPRPADPISIDIKLSPNHFYRHFIPSGPCSRTP